MSEASFHLISREELRHLAFDLGKSDAEIGQMYNVTANTVNQRRRLMNLMEGTMTAAELAETVRLAEDIKHLPMEAIREIKQIVEKYKPQFKYH